MVPSQTETAGQKLIVYVVQDPEDKSTTVHFILDRKPQA